MSSAAMREAEQEAKDLRAELMNLERKLQEGLAEAGLLQTQQDRAQEGANRQSRVRSMNAEQQEDLESRMRTEMQEVEALEDKIKAIDTEIQDAQDRLRETEGELEGLIEERHAAVFTIRRIKMRQVKANEELAHYKDMRGVISAEARHYKAQFRARRVGREELLDRLGLYAQEKAAKESRLKVVEAVLQKDRPGASQGTAESSNAGPWSSGPPTSSEGPDQARGPTRKKGQSYTGRIYLEIPYCDKDEAKALGAQWEPRRKTWHAQSQDIRRKLHRWPEAETEGRN